MAFWACTRPDSDTIHLAAAAPLVGPHDWIIVDFLVEDAACDLVNGR
jgi:hypothetical protein